MSRWPLLKPASNAVDVVVLEHHELSARDAREDFRRCDDSLRAAKSTRYRRRRREQSGRCARRLPRKAGSASLPPDTARRAAFYSAIQSGRTLGRRRRLPDPLVRRQHATTSADSEGYVDAIHWVADFVTLHRRPPRGAGCGHSSFIALRVVNCEAFSRRLLADRRRDLLSA